MTPLPESAPAPERSLVLALVLCVLLGWLGAHRFYLGHRGAGVIYLILTGIGIASAPTGIGVVFGALVLIGCLTDLIRLPGLVRAVNGDLN